MHRLTSDGCIRDYHSHIGAILNENPISNILKYDIALQDDFKLLNPIFSFFFYCF